MLCGWQRTATFCISSCLTTSTHKYHQSLDCAVQPIDLQLVFLIALEELADLGVLGFAGLDVLGFAGLDVLGFADCGLLGFGLRGALG